MKYVLAINRN